jgi:hypothetical protein
LLNEFNKSGAAEKARGGFMGYLGASGTSTGTVDVPEAQQGARGLALVRRKAIIRENMMV